MKYIPALVASMEALKQALTSDAPLLLVSNAILEEARDMLAHSVYIPTDLPCKAGKLYAHPNAQDIDYADSCNLL